MMCKVLLVISVSAITILGILLYAIASAGGDIVNGLIKGFRK